MWRQREEVLFEETGVCADRDDVILWLSHLGDGFCACTEVREEVKSCSCSCPCGGAGEGEEPRRRSTRWCRKGERKDETLQQLLSLTRARPCARAPPRTVDSVTVTADVTLQTL